MGSNIGRDHELCSFVTQVVKDVARVPVWAKLTPATTDIVVEAGAVFRGGADAVSSSNTCPSLPLVDPDTLEFEINVDGYVSSGGLGGPAILPLSLAKMAQMTRAFPDKAFSGIGGVSNFAHALNYFLLGCGTVQVCTAAMLDQAVGPHVIASLVDGLSRVPRAARRSRVDASRGLPRPAARSRGGAVAIRRPGQRRLPGRLRRQRATRTPDRVAPQRRPEVTHSWRRPSSRTARIVTASDRYQRRRLRRERRHHADRARPPDAGRRVVDATGQLVMPGGIDVHTHLDMPFGGTVGGRLRVRARSPPRTAGRRR